MFYKSTRGDSKQARATEAMLDGLAPDGGLYLCELGAIKPIDFQKLEGKSYQEIAFTVLQPFFPEFDEMTLKACIAAAYSQETFECDEIVPVVPLANSMYISELFWGRTMAFKDVALSLFPHFLQSAKAFEGEKRITSILTATSGDTGKAAMEGFRDIDGIEITVFYPEDGVSAFQKLQMQTQEGNNVRIYGIDGNFDDAQSALKRLFQDPEVETLATQHNKMLASANSINIGRLFPQIVYYVSSYLKMVEKGSIKQGEKINVVVPTGNFGNIFAGYIAMKLGLPVKRFISASNDNDVLADFFETGTYSISERAFKVTTSPSMDILISSNFERYLYAVLGEDTAQTKQYMEQLQQTGTFTLTADEFSAVQNQFSGGRATESEVAETIEKVYREEGYLLDPHTAVAYAVGEKYKQSTSDQTPQMIMATAHPYKFSKTVTEALGQKPNADTKLEIETLATLTNTPIPRVVAHLFELPIRFDNKLAKDEIEEQVKANVSEV